MRDFHLPGRSAVFAENGLCATSHPIAAHVAIDILKRGGNAMDAAIAGAVLLGICEPAMTGIGGDCFALFSPPGSDEVLALNGSGRAPAHASAAKMRAQGHQAIPLNSAHAVTMPGAVDAFCHLSENWGKLGLGAILAPAIHYAERGVPVAPRVHFDWARRAETLQGAARQFYLHNGQPPNIGTLFSAPKQADVLRRIAKHGRAGFYSGEVAEDIIASLQALDGAHQLDDIEAVQCTQTSPISGQYKHLELLEHPPNGQGATAHLLLNILSHFDHPSDDPNDPIRLHIEAEASKMAYTFRDRLIADPDQPTQWQDMLSPTVAAKLAEQIDLTQAGSFPQTQSETVHKDTVYITVVDQDRMAVSLIYSIFHGFGSGIASEKFGILMQNRGAGFNLIDGHPNELAAGRRPMHTIIPAMLREKGKVTMPFGVMGGQFQPVGHARLLRNLTDYGMDLQQAIDAPRAFATNGVLQMERGYNKETMAALENMGHLVTVPDVPLGGAQAIKILQSGTLEGASDARKDGCALGY